MLPDIERCILCFIFIFIGFAPMLLSFMVEPSAIVWFAIAAWDVSCAEAESARLKLAAMAEAVIKYFIASFLRVSDITNTFQSVISRKDKISNARSLPTPTR